MSETKRAFTETDLIYFTFVGEAQLSPDAQQVYYTRTVIDKQENTYRSTIWTLPFIGEGARQLTIGPGRDRHPLPDPTGHYLAFLSDRDAERGKQEEPDAAGNKVDPLGTQLFLLPLDGGEAQRITAIRGGILDAVWSADGSKIAFVSAIRPSGARFLSDPVETLDDGEEEDERLFRKFNLDVREHTRAQYREDGVGYLENRNAQIFVIDVAEALTATPALPKPLQITSGPYDHLMPTFSPDGKWIACAATRVENADMAHFSDIWLFPTDGAGQPRKLTQSDGIAFAPRFSPDGQTIAFLGHHRDVGWYTNHQLWVVPTDGSLPPRSLTRAFDRSFEDASVVDMRMGGNLPPTWSAQGDAIFLLASDHGTTHLYRVGIPDGDVVRLTSGDLVLFDGCIEPHTQRAVFSIGTPECPNDIYAAELAQCTPISDPLADPTQSGGAALRPLTHSNDEWLATHLLARPQRFSFHAEGGPPLDGWLIRPTTSPGDGQVPVIVEVHGGPQMMYTSQFFLEFQILAGHGFAVLYTNPRGSQGYGEAFTSDIRGHWGEHDFADLLALIDTALKRYPFLDPQRLGIAGGSYGGFMTSWAIGHSDRFKAAVSMRALNNMHSFFGTSDGGFLWDEVFGGKPWENPQAYVRQSPITSVAQINTPTLVMHSEEDYRCPLEQGQQLYASLKVLGVETKMVQYPGESHGLSRGGRPWHRVHRLRAIASWFAKYLSTT